jgi:manganese oxidase
MPGKRRSGHLVVVAALVVLTVAACGGSGSGSSTGGSPASTTGAAGVAVRIADYAYDPATVTVAAGTTVTWTNEDAVIHTVTSADVAGTDAATTDLFDSGSLGKGAMFSYTFTEPGTYYYLCVPHRSMATMHAEVIVE